MFFVTDLLRTHLHIFSMRFSFFLTNYQISKNLGFVRNKRILLPLMIKKVTIAIDRGGTLCDAIAQIQSLEDNKVVSTDYKVLKLLSVNTKMYKDAPS